MSSTDSVIPYAFEQLAPAAPGGRGVSDVLSAAFAEAAEIRRDAHEAGVAEGRAEGLAAARADAQEALAALARSLHQLDAQRERMLTLLEHDAVDLALRLCEQILAGVLAVSPERVVDVARSALRRLADRQRVTILVNPADLELLGDSVQELQADLGGIEHCAFQGDRRIGRGGAIVRTDAGEIDATIEAQLRAAREIVEAVLSGQADDG